MNVLRAAALFLAMLLPAPAIAGDSLDTMLAAYDQISSLSARYTQETRFAGFSKVQRFAGILDIQRPDQMRWDYREGSDQQIYVQKDRVILYAPRSKQAIVSRLSPQSDAQIPLFLLTDVRRIGEIYTVTQGDAPGQLRLTPKTPDARAPSAIDLWVNDAGLVRQVRISMPGGNQSDITFNDIQTNREIAKERFVFTLPPGVHEVHTESLLPASGTSTGP